MAAIEWNVVATIAAPIIALFIGVWVSRRFESRPILVSYLGHVSAFKYTLPDGRKVDIFTHSVVLRNTGRRAATNVRLHHNVLPDFNIAPSVAHSIETLADGTRDILIPTLVPGEAITISYLYFPPVTWAAVNAGIKFDGGFANAIPVLLQRQYPRWFNIAAAMLMLIGLVAVGYLGFLAMRVFGR